MSGRILDERQRVSQEQRGCLSAQHTLPLTLSQVRLTASGQEQSAENIAVKGAITLIKAKNRILLQSHSSSPRCATWSPNGSK